MKIRWIRYGSLVPLLTACSGPADTHPEPTAQSQQAVTGVFETNRFFGRVGFDNDASGQVGQLLIDNIGTAGCFVSAGSTSIPGLSASASAPGAGLFCDYELSAETQEGGVVYNIGASRHGYGFQAVTGQTLLPKSESPDGTEADLTECIGLQRIAFEDCEGQTVEPENVSLSLPWFRSGASWYAMLRDGSSGDLNVTYTSGSSVFVDRIRHNLSVPYSGQCDVLDEHIVSLECGGGLPDELGELQGPFEVQGETLLRRVNVFATGGPDGNERWFGDSIAPFGHPADQPDQFWLLPNMVPGDYLHHYAESTLRTGYGHTEFRAPFTQATVVAGATVIPSRQGPSGTEYPFVMTPGEVTGAIFLSNPSLPDDAGSLRSFAHLVRSADNLDANDLPTAGVTANSFVGATTDSSGFSFTSFPEDFDPGLHALSSNYALPLMSTFDETRTWRDQMRLVFRSAFDASAPEGFRNGHLDVVRNSNVFTMDAGRQAVRDYNVCFSEVDVSMLLLGGDQLYNPGVGVNGSFSGVNGNEVDVAYTVGGNFQGSPTSLETRSTEGRVFLPLPQGSYQLTPRAQVVRENGSQSSVVFSRINVDVGCGQFVSVRPGLGVSVDLASRCAGVVSTSAAIRVSSEGQPVDRVWYTINGGDPVDICSADCGPDPSFDIEVPTSALSACTNSFQVFASSASVPGDDASTGTSIIHEVPGANCAGECSSGACLVGTEVLDIRDRTRINADSAGGYVEIGADAAVTGHVEADGNAFVRERGSVSGTLSVEGTYSQQNGVLLGDLVNPAGVDLPVLQSRPVNAGTGLQEVPNDATQTLTPGQYGDLTIRARSTVTLTSGTYELASLEVEPDVTLHLDTSAGPIALDVAGDVTFESRITYHIDDPSKLSLYSNGSSVRLHPQQTFPGSILAPVAEVAVYSFVTVNGCIAGRIVRIEADSELNGGAPVVGGGGGGGETPECTTDTDCAGGTCQNGACQPAGSTDLEGTITVISNWETGYCADVRVTNAGASGVSSWTALVDLGDATLNGSWNGTFAVDGSQATVGPVDWNANLAPGSSTSFGFCAAKSSPGAQPSLTSVK